ncbi:MAG: GGDEF domain-containing protein [Deltaproteobacteria bacterium]|nr:GGDEF domain-containing protein [Deltaproteobacteria bacterium]
MHALIERRILLINLRRLQPLLWGIIVFTALILASSSLLRERAIADFGFSDPLQMMIMLRSMWLGIDLFAILAIRRVLAGKTEQTTYLHGILETGIILVNMLFVVVMLSKGYAYNPSLEVLYIALFALAPVIRLNLAKSIIVIGLPCFLVLLIILGQNGIGVVHISNIISLIAITILAMIIFRVMYLSRVRELAQQLTIERQLAEMERLSVTDGLTQLANRRSLDKQLEIEWGRAVRLKLPLALVMMDIDYFKGFNDSYGHLRGDACLQAIARVIERHTRRAGDLGARYGGEEFVILLPNTDLASAAVIAENIRQEIFDMDCVHAGSPEKRVTVSLGVAASCSVDASSGPELLDAADRALYRAKAFGRNRVVLAGASYAEESLL